jgi:hypothetical protein
MKSNITFSLSLQRQITDQAISAKSGKNTVRLQMVERAWHQGLDASFVLFDGRIFVKTLIRRKLVQIEQKSLNSGGSKESPCYCC